MFLFMGNMLEYQNIFIIHFLGTDFTDYTEMRKRIREIRVIRVIRA